MAHMMNRHSTRGDHDDSHALRSCSGEGKALDMEMLPKHCITVQDVANALSAFCTLSA